MIQLPKYRLRKVQALNEGQIKKAEQITSSSTDSSFKFTEITYETYQKPKGLVINVYFTAENLKYNKKYFYVRFYVAKR